MPGTDSASRAAPELQVHRSAGRRRLPSLLRIAATVAIVVVLIRAIDPRDVMVRIGDCPPWIAFAAFVGAMTTQWLASHRLHLLARSQGFLLRRSEALLIGLSTTFYGLFIPGGTATGWAVRLLRLSRGAGRLASAVQMLAGDRALATAVGAVIGLISGLFLGAATPAWITLALLGVAAGATLLCLALFAPAASTALQWARRIPLLDRVALELLARGSILRRPGAGIVVLATMLTFAAHGVGVLTWVMLAGAMNVALDPVSIAWVRSAAMVATLIPATVGGLGLREGTVVFLMGLLGVTAPDALALSLLVFATTIFAVGVVGGVFEAFDLVRRRR